MNIIGSEIVVSDLPGLLQAIEQSESEWHYYHSGDTASLVCDADEFHDVDALSEYAPFIESGYVTGSDYDGHIYRFEFVSGTVQKQIPQWIPA